jgi:hypothetical protein
MALRRPTHAYQEAPPLFREARSLPAARRPHQPACLLSPKSEGVTRFFIVGE